MLRAEFEGVESACAPDVEDVGGHFGCAPDLEGVAGSCALGSGFPDI